MKESLEKKPATEQEQFWSGQFGNDYINRNKSSDLLASNIAFFARIIGQSKKIHSVCEFGANIGMNLEALRTLLPQAELQAVEINQLACEKLRTLIGKENTHNCSITDFNSNATFDLSFTKGVLIHINPDHLQKAYEKIYESSHRYILVAEYYDPNPTDIKYRGHPNKLFKRDFAGELLDSYPDLSLINYGFAYHRDPTFPQDDISWFLLEKI